MKSDRPIAEQIKFHADSVAGFQEQYTSSYVVWGIHFGEGDPDLGGQHWNFSRAVDDDEGVCTVKEIQAAVLYGEIERFHLTRQRLACRFTEAGSRETRVRELVITYSLDAESWAEVQSAAKLVFEGEAYAEIDER